MNTRRQTATPLDEALSLLALPSVRGQSPLVVLRLAWSRLCGPLLARHCEPLSVQGTRLVIGVRGGDWREAVYQQRLALQQRVRQVAPSVREIRLVTIERASPMPREKVGPPPADPRTEAVVDPGLRLALDGLLAARKLRTGA